MLNESQVRRNRDAFSEASDVQSAGIDQRLVGDDADGLSLDAAEPTQHIGGEQFVHLQEGVLVKHRGDDLVHVVGTIRLVRDEDVQLAIVVGDREVGLLIVVVDRRILEVVLWQVGEQIAHVLQRVILIGSQIVRVARDLGVGAGSAQLLQGDVLTGDGLDDGRAGDEHLGALVDHDDEVGEGGGVHLPAGRRPHDDRDLWDDARGAGVALEDVTESGQGGHTFLDARPATFVDADERAAGLHGEVDDLADLLAIHLTQ